MKFSKDQAIRTVIAAATMTAFAGAAPVSAAQSNACPNEGRQVLGDGAGPHVTDKVPCPVITLTFTILGNSITISTPAECPLGIKEYDADCFTCGGTSENNKCDASGFSVETKVYSAPGGAGVCPTGPASIPTTIPEFTRSMMCIPPPLLNTEDTVCASVDDCVTTPDPPALNEHLTHGDTRHGSLAGSVRRDWNAPVKDSLPAAAPSAMEQFRSNLPRVAADQLPGVLGQVYSQHLPLEGVSDLHASVVVEYLAGSPFSGMVHLHDVNGAFLRSGELSVSVPRHSTSDDGASRNYQEVIAFDGASLLTGRAGADVYQAYASSYPGFQAELDRQLFFLQSVRRWVSNPFLIQRLPGTHYAQSDVNDEGIMTITETYPVGHFPSWSGSIVYTVATQAGVARPREIKVLDSQGALLVDRRFDKYRMIGGTWRPLSFQETRFDPLSSLPTIRFSHKISYVKRATLDENEVDDFLPELAPQSGWWVVHE